MFRRKLLALEFKGADNLDINDEQTFRELIVWLEDQKIRHYRIEDRAKLRQTQDADWDQALKHYVESVGCPYPPGERAALVDWLLGFAVRLEFGDNVQRYNGIPPEQFAQQCSVTGRGQSSNPLDGIDFESAEFKSGVVTLSGMLQVPPHSNHEEMAKAICILVRNRLSKQAVDAAGKTDSKKEYIPLEKTEVGFDAGDYISNDAAKILRLLYIRDLRDLQTQINRAIVSVQALTADPRTDQRLGKVGR